MSADVSIAIGAEKTVRVQNLGKNDDISLYKWAIRSNQTGLVVVSKDNQTTPADFVIVSSPTNGEVAVHIHTGELTEAGDYEAQLWGQDFTHTRLDPDEPLQGPIRIRVDDVAKVA